MRTEVINVTPQMAADWLSLNENNRPLRRSTVEGLKAAFGRGEYTMTHQGIAFSTTGELLDGQHRLTAISELRDGVFRMLVARDVQEDSFRVMDIGVKRSPSDALRIDDRRVVEVARLIGTMCMSKRGNVTPLMLLPIIDSIQHAHDSLIAFCPTVAKTWSSTPVRLAAVVAMKSGGDVDYIRATYRALVLSDFEAMSPVAQGLVRSQINGHVRAADAYDMLARCIVVFDKSRAKNSKIQVKATSDAVEKVKGLFAYLIPDESTSDKKKAAPKSAAKSVLQRNFSR